MIVSLRRLPCRFGRHVGQENGGTLVYTCERCHRSLPQTVDYSDVARAADRLIAAGDFQGAENVVARALGREPHTVRGWPDHLT